MTIFLNAIILAETTAEPAGGAAVQFLPFLIIGAAFYFLIIRPQRKRQAEQRATLRRVAVGDEIVTIGGFHGTIVDLEDETMEVELAPGVVVTMARNALSRTLTEPAPFDLDDDDDLDDFDDDDDTDAYDDDFDFDPDDVIDGTDREANGS